MGDFNVHNAAWLKFSNKTDDAGRQAEAFAITHGLEQLVELPTRIPDVNNQSANTLDLFLTTNPDPYRIEVCAPLGNSDHTLISTTCSFHLPSSCTIPPRLMWHYNSADWEGLHPTRCAETISEIIMLGMQTYIPNTERRTSSDKTWFNRNCSRAVASKQAAYHRWLKNPGPETRAAYVEARGICKETIECSKDAHKAKIRSKLAECPNGSRSFWSFVKLWEEISLPAHFLPNQRRWNTSNDCPGKANIFAHLFAGNSTLDSSGKQPRTLHLLTVTCPRSPFANVLSERFCWVSTPTKPVDLTESRRLFSRNVPRTNTCSLQVVQPLLQFGVFPSNWKIARVQPVPKKGKKALPSNYRPIALLSIISKVMEKAINIELMKYLEDSGIVNDRQYGFRHQRSTGDLLAYVSHIWQLSIEKHGETLAVALDISKAFDRVWHQGLLAKLPSYGYPPQLCSLLASFSQTGLSM
ncbi:hypothetical protein JTB14_038225 [Gonioctena quinquepunctata]|nr:hypothetical protein JTB14_038225 [Gonioctena quinquepunctata]